MKYYCPMHPEVESDDPNAICAKCGTMKLVPRSQEMLRSSTPKHLNRRKIRDFLPLIVIFAIVILSTVITTSLWGDGTTEFAMRMFMGSFLIIFGGLKVSRVKAFAEAYKTYDLIAERSSLYAHFYPFLEFALGLAYIFAFQLHIANWITLVVMVISAIGVFVKLSRGEKVMCACLGTVFKLPMTWVTLIEDLLMAGMALFMLLTL